MSHREGKKSMVEGYCQGPRNLDLLLHLGASFEEVISLKCGAGDNQKTRGKFCVTQAGWVDKEMITCRGKYFGKKKYFK